MTATRAACRSRVNVFGGVMDDDEFLGTLERRVDQLSMVCVRAELSSMYYCLLAILDPPCWGVSA